MRSSFRALDFSHPEEARAAQTVYDCKPEPGASPLKRVVIRHDGSGEGFRVSASHLSASDTITGHGFLREGQEVEFSYEVRYAGRLQQIDIYRIDVSSGNATGNVDLYDDDGNYIRGGPLPVDGACAITVSADESFPVTLATASSNRTLCFEFDGPTQFYDRNRYCASSVLAPQGGNSYGPKNLFSGPEGAAWCEGVLGNGEGETVRIEIDPAVIFGTVVIRNGYEKSQSAFSANGRVKVVEIEAPGLRDQFTLKDTRGEQRLTLSRSIRTPTLTVRIVSVYPGAAYADTCLSGLWLDLEGG